MKGMQIRFRFLSCRVPVAGVSARTKDIESGVTLF